MKKLVWLLALLAVPAFAANRPLMICQDACQKFDPFTNGCAYHAKCVMQGDCMSFINCQKWDPFADQCAFEGKETRCQKENPFLTLASCKVTCQVWDPFGTHCLYETGCDYNGRCLLETICEKWDQFAQRCLSERHRLSCR